jgi:hypothetical protein
MSNTKKDKLVEKIMEHRPNLKEASLNMYLRNLAKINKEKGNQDHYLVKVLEDKEYIDKFLENKKDNTKKNYLSSIVVILMAMKKKKALVEYYRNKMELLGNSINQFLQTQKKTEKQNENWVELKSLQKVVNDYRKEIMNKNLLKQDYKNLSSKEKELLKKWVVGSIYVLDPEHNPPLRADIGEMRILKNAEYNDLSAEELKKNYLVVIGRKKKFFHLGEFKTDGKFGSKIIKIGTKLNNVLNKYFINYEGEHLITDSKGNPMTPNQLTKFVLKTFSPTGKQVGISMIRHIVISHLFPPQTEEKKEIADKMLHSIAVQNEYAKN